MLQWQEVSNLIRQISKSTRVGGTHSQHKKRVYVQKIEIEMKVKVSSIKRERMSDKNLHRFTVIYLSISCSCCCKQTLFISDRLRERASAVSGMYEKQKS